MSFPKFEILTLCRQSNGIKIAKLIHPKMKGCFFSILTRILNSNQEAPLELSPLNFLIMPVGLFPLGLSKMYPLSKPFIPISILEMCLQLASFLKASLDKIKFRAIAPQRV